MSREEQFVAKPRIRHPDRVTLMPESLDRLDQWGKQIAARLPGKRLFRADLVNWLVRRHSADLTDDELIELCAEHFDPVKALEWATRQAREAQARGETVNIGEYVTAQLLQGQPLRSTWRRTPRKKKVDGTGQPMGDQSDQPICEMETA